MRRNGSSHGWNELQPGEQFASYAIHSGLLTSLLAGPGLLWDLDRRLLGGVPLSPLTRACPGTQEKPRSMRFRSPKQGLSGRPDSRARAGGRKRSTT